MAALYVGLMSGTSADGMDAALVDFSRAAPRCLATVTIPYPADLRRRLLELPTHASVAELTAIDAQLGRRAADAVIEVLRQAGVDGEAVAGIGSHGHTLWHAPRGEPPLTYQIGDASRIVEATGITTVADFRRRDVAAGGQGAPLAPGLHAALLRDPGETRGVLNLGGMANLTVLPADPARPVAGFDTGPANNLMDAWVRRHGRGGSDVDGAWAAAGTPDARLLQSLLDDAYFHQPPPKSSGPEYFNLDWLAGYADLEGRDPANIQATLLELTVESIAEAVEHWGRTPARLLCCGGGVHNARLMRRLDERLAGIQVESTAGYGLDPDFVEAVAFAWLARQTLNARPGNLAEVTGAAGPRILGTIHPA